MGNLTHKKKKEKEKPLHKIGITYLHFITINLAIFWWAKKTRITYLHFIRVLSINFI